MKHPQGKRRLGRIIILGVALFCLAALTFARPLTTSVNIVNNSDRDIRNVYLSHVGADDWGGDQLPDGSVIAAGHSFTLDNVVCDQEQVKVIGEDQDGCFISKIVSCGQSSTWTVSNDTERDCGY